MTDNLPALPEPTSTEVASADVDSWVAVVADVVKLAGYIAPTEFVPRALRDSAPATAAAILYGREVGLAPMTALTMTHVVEGRPGISAEGMRALVLAAGHDLEFVKSTGAECVIRGRRRGSERWTEVAWTTSMAQAAGLLSKTNWKSYPRDMLVARATGALCRMIFPDVIHGFRTLEELEDMGAAESGPAAAFGAPTPTTPVTRKRAVARKSTTAALPAPAEPVAAGRPAPSGPPLPGEPGYDETSGGVGAPTPPTSPEPELTDEPSDDDGSTSGGEVEPVGDHREDGSSVGERAGGEADDQSAGGREGGAGTDARPAPPRKSSRAQHRMLFASLAGFGVEQEDREERLYIVSRILRADVQSFNDLTVDQAKAVIDTLARLKDRAALDALLDTVDQAEDDRAEVERQDLAGEPVDAERGDS